MHWDQLLPCLLSWSSSALGGRKHLQYFRTQEWMSGGANKAQKRNWRMSQQKMQNLYDNIEHSQQR